MNRKRLLVAASALLLCSATAALEVRADETSGNISISKAISNLKFYGDARLRQENFWKSSPGQSDRSRQRFRLRIGAQTQFDDVTLGMRLVSGTGEQNSTNQSFDNLETGKTIFIDQAYLQWKARDWLKLTGGKMPNPFWRPYTSDIMWDEDVMPEGFAEQVDWKFTDRLSVFANLTQMVLDEDANDNDDQWLFGHQVGAQVKLPAEAQWTVGAAYYDAMNETKNDFGIVPTAAEGNARANAGGVLKATFTLVSLSNELTFKVGPYPVTLAADYLNNVAENGVLGSSGTEKVAYQVGFIFGKASKAMSWEVAYFYKWIESNATFAELTDSDFGDGGTNRRGHIIWLAFNPRDYLQIRTKLGLTEVIRSELAPGPDNIARWQLDVSVKF